MPVIKRYPNRKLYDTDSKQYITLEGIAAQIRQGQDIRVVDYTTGEDLTTLTLTLVIQELEKKQSGFFPRSILSDLIQVGGNRLNTLQRNLASSIGFGRHIDEEIKRRILALISQGELSEAEGQVLIKKLLAPEIHQREESPASPEGDKISTRDLQQYLIDQQVPTRDDLQILAAQLEDLYARLEELKLS
jgi:polyhydroxyalkanoate synthesis repressor PhaR